MFRFLPKKSGFTLVELVIVIVVLGILSAVAIPKFFDVSGDAKNAACKGALGGMRSAIATYYAQSATPSGGGVATFPTIAQLSAAGTVMASGKSGGFGKRVIIDHGDGWSTIYAHMSKLRVDEGEVVEAGQGIGKVGSTGLSTGPHLHFEVRIGAIRLDPQLFLDFGG